MDQLKKIITILLYVFVFFLPLQTRWIYMPKRLNGFSWEYGSFCLYATEILLGLIVLLSIIHASLLFSKASGQRNKTPIKKLFFFFLLLLLFILNIYFAQDQSLAFYKFTHIILAVAYISVTFLVKMECFRLSWIIIISASLQSVIAISQFINQKVVANKWLGMSGQEPSILGTPIVETAFSRWLRTFGTLPHPNILAAFLIISLLLIIYLFINTKIIKRKKQLTALFVLNTLAMLTTLSRSTFLVFIFLLLIMIIYTRGDKPAKKTILRFSCLTIFIFILFTASFPELVFKRMLSTSRVEVLSNNTRIEQYHESWILLKRHPITGVGIGNYTLALTKSQPQREGWAYQPIHNTYLLIINELGVLGFSLLIVALIYFFLIIKTAFQIQKINNKLSIGPICLLATMLLFLFDHFWFSLYFGIIFIATIINLYLLENHEKQNS